MMQVPSIPFKVLALASFIPQEGGISPQHPLRVDKTNVDQVMEGLGPNLFIPLPKHLCPAGGLSIRFNKLKDFHPDVLIRNTPFLRNLLEAKKFVEEAKTKGLSQDEVTQCVKSWPDLPLEIKFEPPKLEIKSESPIDEILKLVSMPEGGPTYSGEIQSIPIQIDSLLRQILSHLFSHEEMRNLE
jgi:type VI secretion system ImpB/VipA family protein